MTDLASQSDGPNGAEIEDIKKADRTQVQFMFNGSRDHVSYILKMLVDHGVLEGWFNEEEANNPLRKARSVVY